MAMNINIPVTLIVVMMMKIATNNNISEENKIVTPAIEHNTPQNQYQYIWSVHVVWTTLLPTAWLKNQLSTAL